MDALDRRKLGAPEADHSARRATERYHGSGDSCDTFADRTASPNAKTDGDSVADAHAARDGVTCGNRKGGAAAHRPAPVRLCGYTCAGDRGDRRGGGEGQETEKAHAKEEITNYDGNRSS